MTWRVLVVLMFNVAGMTVVIVYDLTRYTMINLRRRRRRIRRQQIRSLQRYYLMKGE